MTNASQPSLPNCSKVGRLAENIAHGWQQGAQMEREEKERDKKYDETCPRENLTET